MSKSKNVGEKTSTLIKEGTKEHKMFLSLLTEIDDKTERIKKLKKNFEDTKELAATYFNKIEELEKKLKDCNEAGRRISKRWINKYEELEFEATQTTELLKSKHEKILELKAQLKESKELAERRLAEIIARKEENKKLKKNFEDTKELAATYFNKIEELEARTAFLEKRLAKKDELTISTPFSKKKLPSKKQTELIKNSLLGKAREKKDD